jgi:hypothetical protein
MTLLRLFPGVCIRFADNQYWAPSELRVGVNTVLTPSRDSADKKEGAIRKAFAEAEHFGQIFAALYKIPVITMISDQLFFRHYKTICISEPIS